MATVAIPTPECKTMIADLYGHGEAPSAPAPAPAAPLPEAAFSLTIHGSIGGHPAMLTIRGQSAGEFAANVAAVRGMLDAAPVAPPAPVPQTYGARQAEKALGPVPAERPEGWCALHSVQMKRQTNDRGSWFSHKVGDTWCRGK